MPLAARDIASVPLPDRQFTRYQWIPGWFSPKDREQLARVVSAHVNSLSREPDLTPPMVILSNGTAIAFSLMKTEQWSQATLLRLNCTDYRWEADTYKNLREQSPWTHVKLSSEKTTFALAPWLGDNPGHKSALAALVAETKSAVPILRADNFVWQTAIAEGRKVGYYGLLEITDEKSFDKAVGFDKKASDAFTIEMLAAVSTSGIARQPRRISMDEKIAGQVFKTFDNRLATGKGNPLRVLNNEFTFDASEKYGHLSNGMWACGLFDKDGKKQNAAPSFVGGDRFTHNNSFDIDVYLSCVRCHVDGGLQNVNNWARGLFKGPFPLVSYDPDVLRDSRKRYVRDLQRAIVGARARYAAALLESSGLLPAEYASGLARVFATYDAPVTLERAAQDVGMDPAAMVAALHAYSFATKSLDPVLQNWLRPAGERESLPIEQHHESIVNLYLALKGYMPGVKPK